MTPEQLDFWRHNRIAPTRWRLSPWGDAGGGFWVVALVGDKVVWYFDIEDGFNVSNYVGRGEIGRYLANQDELEWVVAGFVK